MKNPIEWHKECLVNRVASHERNTQEVIKMKKRLAEDLSDNIFYSMQIESAKKQHKDGFDSDRFMKNLNPRTENS